MARNIIKYIQFVCLVVIGLLFYNNYGLYVLLILLLTAPAFSYLILRYTADKISYQMELDKQSVGKSVQVTLILTIKNRMIFPIGNAYISLSSKNLFYYEENHKEVCVFIKPNATEVIKLKLDSMYCGKVQIHMHEIKLCDMLNLFYVKIGCNLQKSFTVFPNISTISLDQDFTSEGEGDEYETQQQKGSDTSEITEIREYIPGDNLKSVHWKLSAKQEYLMVKEYGLPYSRETAVLLELCHVEKDEIDLLLDGFFSYLHYFIKQDNKFKACWYDAETKDICQTYIMNEDDIYFVMEELYMQRMHAYTSDTLAYDQYTREGFEKNSTTFYIALNAGSVTGYKEQIGLYGDRVVILCL